LNIASKLRWLAHRARAMDGRELRAHLGRVVRQAADARWRMPTPPPAFDASESFPRLPPVGAAPEEFRAAVRTACDSILGGRCTLFGGVEVTLDDPPRWQKDYLADVDVTTGRVGFRLNHRALPGGADVKLIWELSRWQPLLRLAQAAWLLGDNRARDVGVAWLENWVATNPPFKGWNWTSALEAGLRLIQFTWIDALLSGAGGAAESGAPTALRRLRAQILVPHLRYVARYRSVGSSANNHLLGELAGLMAASARWPALEALGVPWHELQTRWETEVLAQFAPDGGNREQALHYHLFAFELCWQARAALLAAGRTPAPAVEERLSRAADFFAAVQVPAEPWDYGDSDNATVTPFYADERTAWAEWRSWMDAPASSPSIAYWLGAGPARVAPPACACVAQDWLVFVESGIAVAADDEWLLRWDLSPLGYLATAAHGHLDALHVALWYRGRAIVIDPGTGAYYGAPALRAHLASWEAHNGPRLAGPAYPRRGGPFLWLEHHAAPGIRTTGERSLTGELPLPQGVVRRTLRRIEAEDGWQVDDAYDAGVLPPAASFTVGWHFAPGTRLQRLAQRRFRLERDGVALDLGLDAAWSQVEIRAAEPGWAAPAGGAPAAGVCSPGFRRLAIGPQLVLTAPGHSACVFRTTFLACRPHED
jgi:hypothetical protein